MENEYDITIQTLNRQIRFLTFISKFVAGISIIFIDILTYFIFKPFYLMYWYDDIFKSNNSLIVYFAMVFQIIVLVIGIYFLGISLKKKKKE